MTDSRSAAAPRRRLPVATGLLVLIALAILISLGTWQLQRLHWKQGLLADIAARQLAAPVPLADIEAMAAAGGDIEYRKVTATGRYVNNKERHFFRHLARPDRLLRLYPARAWRRALPLRQPRLRSL